MGRRNNKVTGANIRLNAEIKQEEKKNKQPTHLDNRRQVCYACISEVRTKPNAMYPECPQCWVPGRVFCREMVPYLGPHGANAIGIEADNCSDFDPPLNDNDFMDLQDISCLQSSEDACWTFDS